MTSFAPIVIFVYKRPGHILNLLDSLSQCKEGRDSDLIIFSDGAKNPDNVEEVAAIEEVRRICANEQRFQSVKLIAQERNLGLANSIIAGVSSTIEEYGRAIVLEDDLIVSRYFLEFMNSALDKYEHDDRVGQIGACNFFACGERFPESFFIPIPDCLGWATWKNNWRKFIKNPQEIFDALDNDEKLASKFNGYGSYDFISLLKSNVQKKVDSWAILWHATCMLNNWLTLYPNPSLTNHIESVEATHANVNIIPPLASRAVSLENSSVEELEHVIKAMKLGYSNEGDFYGKKKNTSLWVRLRDYFKS